MKLKENAKTDTEAFKHFLNSLPKTLEYFTAEWMDKCYLAFNAQGIICEGIDDLYEVLVQLSKLGLIEIEVDPQNRVRKFRGLYEY